MATTPWHGLLLTQVSLDGFSGSCETGESFAVRSEKKNKQLGCGNVRGQQPKLAQVLLMIFNGPLGEPFPPNSSSPLLENGSTG